MKESKFRHQSQFWSEERNMSRDAFRKLPYWRIDTVLERAVRRVVRAFDPSIACATHEVTRGNETVLRINKILT